MYSDRLIELGEGEEENARINSTRLKEKLVAAVPGLEENKKGRNVFLSFNIAETLFATSKENCDGNALTPMRAAQIIRNELPHAKYEFNGSLADGSYDELPKSLFMLLRMIIDGTSINAEQSIESSNAVQSLTQLTVSNSVKRKRKQTSDMYHSHGTETALPLYI